MSKAARRARGNEPDSDRRPARGAFYTPPELANQVVASTLRVIRQTMSNPEDLPMICDPACGDGAFLVAARDWLVPVLQFSTGMSEQDARSLAEKQLIGIDIDATAASEAQARLPGARIFHGDTLLDVDLESLPRIHAFVGNPPFLGGGKISGVLGDVYRSRLVARFGKAGNADLCAFFFLRCAEVIEESERPGLIGFIATNTIAQGDTRQFALQPLITQRGWTIYDAHKSMPWPGDAKVTISIVSMSRGLQWDAR